MSILEKLHVPEGWCSSGLRANEYTAIESASVLFVAVGSIPPGPLWCCHTCVLVKYVKGLAANLSCPLSLSWNVVTPKALGVTLDVFVAAAPVAPGCVQIISLTGWFKFNSFEIN